MTTAFTYDALPQERVHFGRSVREVLGDEVERLGAKRVFVATSKTLREKTGAISLIATTLGNECAAIFDDIAEHAKLDGVLAAVHAARDAKADLLVGVGGGSIIDGLKVVQLALAENATMMDALLPLANKRHMKPTPIRQIAIPTTLSGAEVTPAGGGTDADRGQDSTSNRLFDRINEAMEGVIGILLIPLIGTWLIFFVYETMATSFLSVFISWLPVALWIYVSTSVPWLGVGVGRVVSIFFSQYATWFALVLDKFFH